MDELNLFYKDICEELNELELQELDSLNNFKKKSFDLKGNLVGIVNSKSDGRIILLSKQIIKDLNCPNTIQFRILKKGFIVSDSLSDSDYCFPLKTEIYSTELVEEITKNLKLKFDEKEFAILENVNHVKTEHNTIIIVLEQ